MALRVGQPEARRRGRPHRDEIDRESPDDMITVAIPEFVVTHWFTNVLHNQSALALKARLLYRPNTVVTSVPVIVG